MATGKFIPYYLPFQYFGAAQGVFIPPQDQAKAIFLKATELLQLGFPGVAIIYSANEGQTILIGQTYQSGGWDTHTNGSNQAQVMHEMELLEATAPFAQFQGKLRIAPITTIKYPPNDVTSWNAYVGNDLANIQSLLDNGWAVLGWYNQLPLTHYAIGGGVAGKLPTTIDDTIQQGLQAFSKNYA